MADHIEEVFRKHDLGFVFDGLMNINGFRAAVAEILKGERKNQHCVHCSVTCLCGEKQADQRRPYIIGIDLSSDPDRMRYFCTMCGASDSPCEHYDTGAKVVGQRDSQPTNECERCLTGRGTHTCDTQRESEEDEL